MSYGRRDGLEGGAAAPVEKVPEVRGAARGPARRVAREDGPHRYGPALLDRLRASSQADPRAVAALTALPARLDPFGLAQTVDRKLERLFALGHPGHGAPASAALAAPAPRRRRDRRPPLTSGRTAQPPSPRSPRVTS